MSTTPIFRLHACMFLPPKRTRGLSFHSVPSLQQKRKSNADFRARKKKSTSSRPRFTKRLSPASNDFPLIFIFLSPFWPVCASSHARDTCDGLCGLFSFFSGLLSVLERERGFRAPRRAAEWRVWWKRGACRAVDSSWMYMYTLDASSSSSEQASLAAAARARHVASRITRHASRHGERASERAVSTTNARTDTFRFFGLPDSLCMHACISRSLS